jgi:hypothetical protein
MNRRLAAAALASLGLLATGFMTTPAAQASTVCTINGITPGQVSVGLTAVAATVRPQVTGCTLPDWYIYSEHLDVYSGDARQIFDPRSYDNDDAGFEQVRVGTIDSASLLTVRELGFTLVRQTSWQAGSINASPEPARKGSTITVKGRLLVANWDTLLYTGHANATVALEFRTPTGTYALVKYINTSSTGWVTTTVTATRTGYWRLRYGGSTIAAAVTSTGDSVTVY